MRLLTLLLILSINNLSSQELKNIDTTKSSISYSGNHFLHKWSAENNNLSGLIKIDNENILNIGVVAKVADFKSGNSSLDSNSYRVLEALKFPNIIFKSLSVTSINGLSNIKGLIEFHGIEKNIDVNVKLTTIENTTQMNGEFTLNLSDFSIDRPSLLLRKIDNEIKIEFILFFI
ncbi:MAG: YceI family protein [Flavobacteriaceae bacterium]|jgi:polyisoprenoid-binding protein YceI|nr:YceI family protein [Flavobacteriaceae bacterium]